MDPVGVAKHLTPSEYQRQFMERLKMIRVTSGYEPKEFAEALGIKTNTYLTYERRSLLPHHLIPKVCEITGHHPWHVLTGQPAWKSPGQPPNEPPHLPHQKRG
jgi:DNA-binding XRE family transcriptional regulator